MPREPTTAQTKVLTDLRAVYGRSVVKPHAPNPDTGIMRVTLTCMAGAWEWYYNTAGEFIDSSMTLRLFDPPAPEHKPRSALDN